MLTWRVFAKTVTYSKILNLLFDGDILELLGFGIFEVVVFWTRSD